MASVPLPARPGSTLMGLAALSKLIGWPSGCAGFWSVGSGSPWIQAARALNAIRDSSLRSRERLPDAARNGRTPPASRRPPIGPSDQCPTPADSASRSSPSVSAHSYGALGSAQLHLRQHDGVAPLDDVSRRDPAPAVVPGAKRVLHLGAQGTRPPTRMVPPPNLLPSPPAPHTTTPLRSPFRQPSTFTSAGMTRSACFGRWNRTPCSLFSAPGEGLALPDMIPAAQPSESAICAMQ